MKSPVYFIDIDGTVADNTHRLHFISDKSDADWASFFHPDRMMDDVPIQSARRHFHRGRFVHGPHVFLTARIQSTYEVSRRWLITHGFATAETAVLCKPDLIRLQRAKVFKPSVLATCQKYDYPNRKLILIEDYGEVRRSTVEAGFGVLHAPDCWDLPWTCPECAGEPLDLTETPDLVIACGICQGKGTF